MEKITLTKIDTTDHKGDALISKQGKPYSRHTLKIESRGDRFISGFANETSKQWSVGQEVDIIITESDKMDKNGKPYLNWSLPKKGDLNGKILEDIYSNTETILNKMVAQQIRIEQILEAVAPKKKVKEEFDIPYPTRDDSEDVPF